MATASPAGPPAGPAVVLATPDGGPPELILNGEIGPESLGELESLLAAPPVSDAERWSVDMSGLLHLDLACAYAILRAVTRRPEPATVVIRGARRTVRRTLHHCGLDAVAEFESA